MSDFEEKIDDAEDRVFRLLILQLTARMDEAERNIIALREENDLLRELFDDGLEDVKLAVLELGSLQRQARKDTPEFATPYEG
jgi:hypothetical protein